MQSDRLNELLSIAFQATQGEAHGSVSLEKSQVLPSFLREH
jgi:hypothetical protein